MIVFGFVLAKKAEHSISMMCRVGEVSRSGYHAWIGRSPSARALEDARLTARIAVLHRQRRGVYGTPRIWADLVLDDGERIGRKRVERLMRKAGLSGLITKKWETTTIRVPGVRVAEDLLDRQFAAAGPNRCWVADITYLRTWEGWLYLVAVQDLYSRRIVGWSMADHMRTELVTDALQMALAHRSTGPHSRRRCAGCRRSRGATGGSRSVGGAGRHRTWGAAAEAQRLRGQMAFDDLKDEEARGQRPEIELYYIAVKGGTAGAKELMAQAAASALKDAKAEEEDGWASLAGDLYERAAQLGSTEAAERLGIEARQLPA